MKCIYGNPCQRMLPSVHLLTCQIFLEKLWAPVFFDKLEDAEGLEGGQLQFSCTVSGKPAPEILW